MSNETKSSERLKKAGLVGIVLFFPLLLAECAIRTLDAVRGDGFFSSPRNVIARSVRISLPFRTFGIDSYREVDGRRFISSRYQELYPIAKAPGTIRIVSPGIRT